MSMLTQHQREQLAYQYTIALEQGDIDSVARILALAEDDVQLEQIIIELNQVLESELSYSQHKQIQEATTMPVFTTTKRKRGVKRSQWTTAVAVFVSTLFSAFVLFFATQTPTTLPANAENSVSPSIDRSDIIYQYLDAWNNNSPQLLEGLLTDDYQYHEAGQLTLDKIKTQQRINQLNESFAEIHFMLENVEQTMDALSADITLKARHADMLAVNRSYFAEGTIELTFVDDRISETDLSINLDRFSAEYGLTRTDAQNDIITHVLQEGETMHSIVKQYQIPYTLIPDILEYNGYDRENGAMSLSTGTRLQIPASNSALLLSPPEDFDKTLFSDHIEIDDDGVKGLHVYIDAGQANLRMGTLPDTVFMADIENIGNYEYIENGQRIKLLNVINHPYEVFKGDGERPTWFFKVSEQLPGDYNIRAGNGEIILDLSNANLYSLQLSMGSGEATISLPDTGLSYHVVLETLSDDAVINLDYPSEVGLKIEADDGIWQSRNYNEAESAIMMQLTGSISTLNMLGN